MSPQFPPAPPQPLDNKYGGLNHNMSSSDGQDRYDRRNDSAVQAEQHS